MPGYDRVLDPLTGDYISDGKGSYVKTKTIKTQVYHQMRTNKGQWVGDPDAGNELFTIEEISEDSLQEAARMSKDALQVFVANGSGANPSASAARDEVTGRMRIDTTIEDVQNGEVPDTQLLPVGV